MDGQSDATLQDFRMTRGIFVVTASKSLANMSIKQNGFDCALEYPLTVKVGNESFFADEGLTGSDYVDEASSCKISCEISSFSQILCSEIGTPVIHLNPTQRFIFTMLRLRSGKIHQVSGNIMDAILDNFLLTIAEIPPLENMTKCVFFPKLQKPLMSWDVCLHFNHG